MSKYLSKVNVVLRKSILDPQGKAVHHALESLGLTTVIDVRMGKYIELTIDATNIEDAHIITESACKKLLVNPVMEDYTYTLEKLPDVN